MRDNITFCSLVTYEKDGDWFSVSAKCKSVGKFVFEYCMVTKFQRGRKQKRPGESSLLNRF